MNTILEKTIQELSEEIHMNKFIAYQKKSRDILSEDVPESDLTFRLEQQFELTYKFQDTLKDYRERNHSNPTLYKHTGIITNSATNLLKIYPM